MKITKKPKFLCVDDIFIYRVKLSNCVNDDTDEQFILARGFDEAYEIACEYQIDNWNITIISEVGYVDKIQTSTLEQFERIRE